MSTQLKYIYYLHLNHYSFCCYMILMNQIHYCIFKSAFIYAQFDEYKCTPLCTWKLCTNLVQLSSQGLTVIPAMSALRFKLNLSTICTQLSCLPNFYMKRNESIFPWFIDPWSWFFNFFYLFLQTGQITYSHWSNNVLIFHSHSAIWMNITVVFMQLHLLELFYCFTLGFSTTNFNSISASW